ncbi:MAG: glycosyltransferase family 4 protein [Propionibacteriaceae bacterium]
MNGPRGSVPAERGLRVGLVCPYSFATPGGVQNHVLGLAGHLLATGHRPHILAPGVFDPARAAAYGLGPAHFTSAGPAIPVPYNGSVARVNFGPVTAGRVRHWLRSRDLDLVHLHEPITPSVSVLALWSAEVPIVATFHTATPRSRSMELAGNILRPSIEKIDAGIAVSETARRVVVQHLGRDAVVVPNGFQRADFLPTPNGVPRRARPRLTFLGRSDEPRKGLDTLLGALPAIRNRVRDLDVVVAGGGRRRLPPGVRRLGVLEDRARVRLLQDTDLFVAPHLARESFGLVLIEAMAAGAGVVASDLPAFVDVLHPGRTGAPLGRTFPVGDPDALARTSVRMLSEPDPARRRAAAAATARYDWSLVGVEVLEVYRATLAC